MLRIKIYLIIILVYLSPFQLEGEISTLHFDPFLKIVKNNKRIIIPGYPQAYNPSLIETEKGLLLLFRVSPFPQRLYASYLGAVFLNSDFEIISAPQLISTRKERFSQVISQSEDARVIRMDDKLYLVYNDNVEIENPSTLQRRDIFLAELHIKKDRIELGAPLLLMHPKYYATQRWQKNWTPFVWNHQLLFSYMINPHKVLDPNLENGLCPEVYSTHFPDDFWPYGTLRGGTPALLVDGEYLAFFHSSILSKSEVSDGLEMWHYLMGAYTYQSDPPFQVTRITPHPIIEGNFYNFSNFYKRVIFLGGYIISGDHIHIALGKDDAEIWICTIDKNELIDSLIYIN